MIPPAKKFWSKSTFFNWIIPILNYNLIKELGVAWIGSENKFKWVNLTLSNINSGIGDYGSSMIISKLNIPKLVSSFSWSISTSSSYNPQWFKTLNFWLRLSFEQH